MATQTQGRNFAKNADQSFSRTGGSSGPAARTQAHIGREHTADPDDGAENVQGKG